MSRFDAFRPVSTVTLTAGSVSSAATIPASCPTLEVQNEGTVTVFLAWAVSGAVATTAGYPIMPGQAKTITIESGHASVAAITAGGTATLYVTAGEGL